VTYDRGRGRAAAAAHFQDLTTPAGRSFEETATMFLTLLSPGILNTRDKWWVKARLWKLILSQAPSGFFEPSSSVAFALEARSVNEVAQLKTTFIERLQDKLANMGDVAEDLASGDIAGALGGRAAQDVGGVTPTPEEERAHMQTRTQQQRRLSTWDSMRPGRDAPDEVHDDPLLCSPHALLAAMPRRLEELQHASAVDALLMQRVWTTMCCIALLETLNYSWLDTDGCVLHVRVHNDMSAC
jgi:hypothetical protein